MKIRLALVDSDEDYRKRLSDFYIKNYHDRIEIMAFSSLDSFEKNRGNKPIDVMLVSESIEEDLSWYTEKMSVAYLSDRDLIERKNNIKAVNKFKKPEKIYKEILNILADSSNGDIDACKRRCRCHIFSYCIWKKTCNARNSYFISEF